jgi:hypothetical protein
MDTTIARWLSAGLLSLAGTACMVGADAEQDFEDEDTGDPPTAIAAVAKGPRYIAIRNAASARGVRNAYLLAGIANTESNLAHCWSEATWACQGPASPDCGGGPVIAGAGDGPCSIQQGGLGMFQFDAGTFNQTLAKYGASVLTIHGQIGHAINYVTNMVKISAYTTNAETDAKARAWIDNFDPYNPTLRDQWIKTVLRYYNGCQPGWSCWAPRIKTYTDGFWAALDEPGGLPFWRSGGGTSCNGSPATTGLIDEKYRALGGCGSFLGAPTTPEMTTPDGVGRYSVFHNGSIYWTPATGAFEVHGLVRDKWAALGWEVGFLGYPITDETPTPDLAGRYNVFQGGSIYFHPATGAHAVYGRIRDKWAELGWEAGALGYPTTDEYAVDGGARSDFQHGSITYVAASDSFIVETTP